MPGTHVATTVQIFIVVVMPGTHVATTVPVFIVRRRMMRRRIRRRRRRRRAQKVSLKSLKIAYVIVKPLYLHTLVHELAVAKSYGLKSWVNLGSDRANFKVTLLERPPGKLSSTSYFA